MTVVDTFWSFIFLSLFLPLSKNKKQDANGKEDSKGPCT